MRPDSGGAPVLVVDDDDMLARTLADILAVNGFTAHTASNGIGALALAEELKPTVAIVDLRLPDMDGLDLASKLHERAQDLQVVILTGNASVETAIRALRDERCEYLLKPVEPGALVRVLRAADDRRRLRSAQEALQRSQELVRAVFEASPLPIIVRDAARVVTLWNPAAARLFGWAAGEVVGRAAPIVPAGEAEEVATRLEAVSHGETFVGLEVRGRTKDGRVLQLRQTLAPIAGPDGSVAATLAVFEDITEQRRMDEQLRDAQRLDQIGRLAGGVAHDFNNLLTVITTQAEMSLGDPGLSADTRESFNDILSAARAGTDLTRQLLAFARRRPIELVLVEPNKLIGDIERLFRRLVGERVTLRTDLAPNAGSTMADAGQLEQVLANLMVNARDAMPSGGLLTVSTRRHREPSGGRAALEGRDWVVIGVADTGTGIPEPVRARIFEPFFTTKPRGQGTGLGLATCYGIVQRFGGHIAVESTVGQGSLFSVYLPRTSVRGPEATPERPMPAVARGGNVLVVEDQPALRAVARRVLEREGHVVHTAETGTQALELISALSIPPDVVLLDVNLPDGDGRDVARAITDRYGGVAVVMTSGAPETLKELGDNVPLLEKPYSVLSLAAAVRAAIDRVRR